ncbi:MAG: nucleotidyltransferase family protein, partial [Gammaproteobacteria bacterium]|nr:nucleotidyltransferase family protein [Gammaproteobacteria bacterium]
MGVLVEAAYHSDPNIASQKWECWKPNNLDLDTIDWQTARLLAQAATILSSRGIESTNLATQKVIKRFEWALGENQLQNVRPLLNASAQAGIPIMVFKGAAMHLSGFADGAPRLMADID